MPAFRGEGVETIDKDGECRGESSGELVSELDPDPELVSSETSLPRLPPSSAACPENSLSLAWEKREEMRRFIS
jgi:hypothetical protein